MLNENIRKLRKSKGLSQEELAIKLNVVRQKTTKNHLDKVNPEGKGFQQKTRFAIFITYRN